jgi:hypothetical protein
MCYNKSTKGKKLKPMKTYEEIKEHAIQRLWAALEECETLGIYLVDTRDGREEDLMNLTYKED